jgi:hypothetical protein
MNKTQDRMWPSHSYGHSTHYIRKCLTNQPTNKGGYVCLGDSDGISISLWPQKAIHSSTSFPNKTHSLSISNVRPFLEGSPLQKAMTIVLWCILIVVECSKLFLVTLNVTCVGLAKKDVRNGKCDYW